MTMPALQEKSSTIRAYCLNCSSVKELSLIKDTEEYEGREFSYHAEYDPECGWFQHVDLDNGFFLVDIRDGMRPEDKRRTIINNIWNRLKPRSNYLDL